jgi:hypothetical protein
LGIVQNVPDCSVLFPIVASIVQNCKYGTILNNPEHYGTIRNNTEHFATVTLDSPSPEDLRAVLSQRTIRSDGNHATKEEKTGYSPLLFYQTVPAYSPPQFGIAA